MRPSWREARSVAVGMTGTLDQFVSHADVRERHEALVAAPARLTFDVAENFELDSLPIVRTLFWLRAKLLGARYEAWHRGLLGEMEQIGWQKLAYTPGRELVMGAAAQPWVGDVKFRAIPPETFAVFDEPGLVKIAWTLEAEPVGPALTRFATETRVIATDEDARKRFRAYWRKFGLGILLIRWVAVPAVKREAERRYKMAPTPSDPRTV